MKNKIILIISELYNVLGEEFCNSNIYEVTAYIAVLYAKCLLGEDKFQLVKDRLSIFYLDTEGINDLVDANSERILTNKINEILLEAPTCNVIANVYEILKRNPVKTALALIGVDNNKLKGQDVIRQTQFFTDQYMTEFLLNKVFDLKGQSLINCAFIDPAVGGGNMLLAVFDRLYAYFKNQTEMTDEEIVNHILENMIVGYDIDSKLSKISAFTLFVYASRVCIPKQNDIFIYGSNSNDFKGYLGKNILSNQISGLSFFEKLNRLKDKGTHIVYLTNPPFMGKRDMDVQLKNFLQQTYPSCKGDLCFSFTYKILSELGKNDLLAAVTQNGWLNLVSLKKFRYELLSSFHLYDCADLGSNAFENINGDKVNVVLCVFGKKNSTNAKEKTRFYNFRKLSYSNKVKAICSAEPFAEVPPSVFCNNINYEFNYMFTYDSEQVGTYHYYKEYGKCMQGSSTGDNKSMVKYIWETNDKDWVLASKGGGFSKWQGLNYYKVKWGEKGELLKNNKGSALRNENFMNQTQLVYSDTGTLGMNVRLIQPKQVFIASGPGIMVKEGKVLCHLAFLNSRAASFLIKVLNPKFTLSAGYIGMLPIPSDILFNKTIEQKARECVRLKKSFLSHKIPNLEFEHHDYSNNDGDLNFIYEYMCQDITNQLMRFEYEQEIDTLVLNGYNFNDYQIENYHSLTGGLYDFDDKSTFDIDELDHYIASHIKLNCMPISRKLNGFLVGTENILEMMSFDYHVPSIRLAEFIIEHIRDLKETRCIYVNDLLHKLVLYVLGITNLSEVGRSINVDITKLDETLQKTFPGFYRLLKVDRDKIVNIVSIHHNKSFFNKPFIYTE